MQAVSICAAMTLAMTLAIAAAPPGRAQPADAKAGETLAQERCAPCHGVAGGGGAESKRAQTLEEIAKGPKGGSNALRDFLHSTQANVSHPGAMPNLGLSERQTADLSAYLATLRKD